MGTSLRTQPSNTVNILALNGRRVCVFLVPQSKHLSFSAMSHSKEKGSLKKPFHQRRKEKLEANDLHFQELSRRVTALELERSRLQRALKCMTNTEQDMQGPTGAQELPDNGEMAVALCFGESAVQLQLTKGGIRAISLDTTAAIWKTLVQKMAFFLDKVDAAQMFDCPQACLDAIVHEGGAFVWALSEHNPRMLTALTICNVEAPSAAPSSSSNHADWQAILVRMQLTGSQVEQLLAGRRTFSEEMGTLTAEWQHLWAQLKKIMDIQEVTDGAVISFVKVADLTKQLYANVHAMNTCRHDYLSNAFTRVLTPVQVARFFVASYPMGPDLPSLLTFLAMQDNGPSLIEAPRIFKPEAAADEGTNSGPPSTKQATGVKPRPAALGAAQPAH
ncbi:hypothetical protein WJX75_001659 [Coccomyxa subellipsoidea]|uniref:BZIP domain-containing protein n=1 Tax=Coccomyxa subellipsoidea TaxID=248742 RepID=A0ABR2YUS4_9CHLO